MKPLPDLDDLAPTSGSMFANEVVPCGPAVDDETLVVGSSWQGEPDSIETDRRQDVGMPGVFGGREGGGLEDQVARPPGVTTADGYRIES